MSKIKEFFANSKKKLIGISTASMMAVATAIGTSASGSQPNGVETMTTAVKTALGDFSVANLVTVITAGLAIAVPLILAWFAFRWVFRKAKGALKSGK